MNKLPVSKLRQGRTKASLLTAGALSCSLATISYADNPTQGPVKPIEVNQAKAELGKRLFFDPRLSGDAELSCSSCHIPEKAFTDGKELSDAYPGSLGFRNTPTLINTAYRKAWFHDGRQGTNLNDVTREMITETYLMNMDMRLMQERIKQDPVYVDLFEKAGLGEPSNGGVRKAIPEYLKTLTSRNSSFDKGEMSASAARGYELFKGKAGCISCHSGDTFTDDMPYNTGVPQNTTIYEDPLRHVTYVTYAKFMGIENYMNLREDVGAYVRTHRNEDKGTFLTPSLRELTYTAPYMHNGTFESLDAVVSFYNTGGGDHPNKDPRIKDLELKAMEQRDLVNFLKSLSGDPLTGPDFVPEEIDTEYEAITDWNNTVN